MGLQERLSMNEQVINEMKEKFGVPYHPHVRAKHVTPVYDDLKCDLVDCRNIAEYFFEDITPNPFHIRNMKVCPTHAEKYKDDAKPIKIAYLENAEPVKLICLRCGHKWIPLKPDFYSDFVLPLWCGKCASTSWRRTKL